MDKNKIIEAAAKLVAKGAYDKAIKEYQKVLDVDPRDVRILQKMGELYQKKNDSVHAATFFTRVAESYTNDGFFLKAVALYKQVLKLDPSLLEINLKLAELHQQLQLLSEAMAYFQIVANHYDKSGDTRRSLDVLKKMVELDPDKVASRVKLADLYAREGLNAEATEEFTRAADHLRRHNQTDDYVRVAERLSSLTPDNLQLAKELAEIYLQRHDQKRALAKLQVCFKADNRDIDTLRLLAVAFQGLGQTAKTISVYKELARAWEEKGRPDEAEQVWAQVGRLDPHDPELAAHGPRPQRGSPVPTAAYGSPAAEPASPVPSGASPPPSPYAAQGSPAPGRPRGDSVLKLLTETDVYVKYGLHDKALEHLRKVFAVEPENIDAHEKAYAIYVASNNHSQAFEQLLNVLRLHTRGGDAQRAQPFLQTILKQNPAHPEVPVFVATLGLGEGAGLDEGTLEQEEALIVESGEDELVAPPLQPSPVPRHPPGVIALGEDVGAAAQPSHHSLEDEPWGESAADDDPALRVAATARDDDGDWGDEGTIDEQAEVGLVEELHTGEYALADVGDDDTGSMSVFATPAPIHALPEDATDERTHLTPRFEPGQETTGSEVPALDELVAGEGAELQWAEPDQEELAAAEEPVVLTPEDEQASEEVDEATFFVEQGLDEEAREILETVLIAYPGHERAGRLLSQLDQRAAPEAVSTDEHAAFNGESHAFDLAKELADELGAEDAALGAALGGDDYQVSVEEVFAEFKKGLEKVVKPEDVDTHYDLGVAYKEMGLIDDAVSEFTIARKGCLGKRKEVDCLSMIGILQLLRGDPAAGVEAFQQALATEFAQGELERSLRYELATAYESGDQQGRALGQFLRVQRLDPRFREVEEHVRRLSSLVAPEDDELPPRQPASPARGGGASGARKVGYV